MRSSFFEFHVATAGMHTARHGARVAGHNMANIATPGFSRQVALQQASTPLPTFNRTGMVGTGSEIIGINQIRNVHLDNRFWNENPILGRQSTRFTQLYTLETGFGEMDGVGFTNSFDRFFASLQNLTTEPSSAIIRNSFLQEINAMTRTINDRALALRRQQEDINREIRGLVTMMNTLGEQIANLNVQIVNAEIRGDRANDLRDRRAVLIDELSSYINLQVTERHVNGIDMFFVHIDGQEFVRHDLVMNIETRIRDVPNHPHDARGLYDLFFNGFPFNSSSLTQSGQLRGLLEARDGNSTRVNGQLGGEHVTIDFRGIPYYLDRLNSMVRTIANAFNFGIDIHGDPIPHFLAGDPPEARGHVHGYAADGTFSGIPLFVFIDPDGNPIYDPDVHNIDHMTIFNFALNPAIRDNPERLATSLTSDLGVDDNSLLMAFVEVRNYPSLFREGTVMDFLNSVMAELAMDLQDAGNFLESQSDVMELIQNQRLQVKGVSMDEEMTSLLMFQHHFQASARLITVIDTIYDTMINRMGA